MSGDSVRLPNGKTTTRSRALNRGWIDAEGNLTDLAPRPSSEQRERDRQERNANWRRTQGLPPLAETAPKDIEPLKPTNVTPDGEPITDDETLAEIAERTARIEFEKAQKAKKGGSK